MQDFPYPGKFTFVDVEIPNLNNDCICAISIIVVENHKETERHTELINPKTFFSAQNIQIHHILRKDVLNARSLEEYWKDYGRYFEEPYILVAHNTNSDMCVINKDLSRFHEKIHASYYIDTMDIMEQFYYRKKQKKGDLRLNHIAERLGIEIDHHNPESDVNVCFEILKYMYRYFDMDLMPFIKPIPEYRPKPPKPSHKPSRNQMSQFLTYTRRQISQNGENAQISKKKAKARGDQAFRAQDYEGIIFNYELAIAKESLAPSVYMRLAQTYDGLNMQYDAIRVLNRGIKLLQDHGVNWYGLKGVQQKIIQMQTSKLEKQKARSSRKLKEQVRVHNPGGATDPQMRAAKVSLASASKKQNAKPARRKEESGSGFRTMLKRRNKERASQTKGTVSR